MKTIKITYTSSGGTVFDLKAEPIRIKAANFHNYAWSRETVNLQYGERLVAFGKKAQVYQTTLYLDQNPEALANLHREFERDIITQMPGRITWNENYIECFISSSSTYPTAGNAYIANEVEIYCMNPFWIQEKHFYFAKSTGVDAEFLEYSYDYEYDYSPSAYAARSLWGYEFGRVAFKAIIDGPAVNPSFTVAGRTYGVNVTLASGEKLTIDTRSTALIGEQVYRGSGNNKTNLFHLREGENIEPFMADSYGMLAWSQEFSIDLTVYMGRSEPSWL